MAWGLQEVFSIEITDEEENQYILNGTVQTAIDLVMRKLYPGPEGEVRPC
jgi:hypothetical protein